MDPAGAQNSQEPRSHSWPHWSWGTQFAVALAGTILWGVLWIENVIPPRTIETHSTAQALLVAAVILLVPLLALAFLLWTLNLAWKQRFFLVQWNNLNNRQRAVFTGIFLFVGALDLCGQFAAHHSDLIWADYLSRYRFLAFWLCWTAAFCWTAFRNGQRPASLDAEIAGEEIRPGAFLAPVRRWWSSVNNRILAIWFLNLFLVLASPRKFTFLTLAVISLVLLFAYAHQAIQSLAYRGRYRMALWISHLLFWSPAQLRQERGWVLLEAGRWKDAQRTLKPVAFHRDGKPNLTSYAFYFYAAALMSDNREPEAEKLLEAAVQVEQKTNVFLFGLADCLLSQDKDPQRARSLLNQAQSDPMRQYTPEQRLYFRQQCLAMEAWSLAAEGLRDASLAKLEQVFENSERLTPCQQASLTHLKGLALSRLGDISGAAQAYRRALDLFPYGFVEVHARKRLAELEKPLS